MFVYPKEYDVLVIGAGHAGVEAALAAAQLYKRGAVRQDAEPRGPSLLP